ncbi:syntaxin-8 isoform X2 [Mustela putorius furo]|uniref:Syntaxin-8 n=1 Tax=Mustela putorius furo TaxID=9669 RepID=A0A8U0V4C1_MUSPF|nr:syntaxin-8 isoform X2 [Mustela putorius furo]
MAPDPWFSTYDSTCQIAQEIAEKIQQQNQYERNGENTIRLTVTIRTLLQNLKDKIALLKDLLLRAVSTHQITQLEGDRRQNLLDELVTRERLLVASFKNEGAEPDLIRSSLMTGGAKRGVPNPWLFEEPEETRGLGFDELRQQQQKIIQEQDAGLDALSSIISRQKQMGKEIGNELDEQNEIIDDLANLVENTDGKLRTETRRVTMVDRKSASCGLREAGVNEFLKKQICEINPVVKCHEPSSPLPKGSFACHTTRWLGWTRAASSIYQVFLIRDTLIVAEVSCYSTEDVNVL